MKSLLLITIKDFNINLDLSKETNISKLFYFFQYRTWNVIQICKYVCYKFY